MNNFVTLYRYEWKKLLENKSLWITAVLLLGTVLISCTIELLVGDYYVDGVLLDSNYNMYVTDKAYAEALSGRAIDQELLEETIAAYRRIPAETEKHYILTPEYQNYARAYSPIFNFARQAGMADSVTDLRLHWEPSEEALYDQWQVNLQELWEDYRLTQGEIQFWQGREAKVEKPMVFYENGGYHQLFTVFQTVGFLVLLLISIALSGTFYHEHNRKTDQIILACPLGKTTLYWAKIAAGVSFAVLTALLFSAVAFLTVFCLYGTSGFDAAFQLLYIQSGDPITCGQAILIAYGCMIFAAIVVSVFVMVLSELLRSNLATLAISAGLLMLPMVFSIPAQFRVAAQIWDWQPWAFLAPCNVFGCYTLSLFGRYFTPWQAAPMLYLLASAALAFLGKQIYQRFQVSGR